MNKNQLLEMFPVGDPMGRRILMDPVTAIMGGISAGTSIIGGITGSSAAKNAAKAQAAAGEKAAQTLLNTANNVNPNIQAQAEQGANWAITNAQNAGADVKGAARQANNLLDPYVQAGADSVNSLKDMLAPGGQLSKQFTGADMEAYDPGYQFRLEQGQKALERSAAARGGSLGGGSLKALTRYSQGVASDEYNNAFNRFLAGNQQQYNMRSGLAGMGLGAANTSGQNTIGANTYAGNANIQGGQFGASMLYDSANQQARNQMTAAEGAAQAYTGIGNAQAAGDLRSASAWNSALGGIGNTANSLMLGNMMKGGSGGGGGIGNSGTFTGFLPTTPGAGDMAGLNMWNGYQVPSVP